MKLADKYELAELLTSGRVTTFAGKERATQDPVVIHMYECTGPNPPSSTASILTRFVAIAPNPPGIVMKAGIDEESSSAFLVTKMPTAEALQEWVRAYRSFQPAVAKPASPSTGTGPVRPSTPAEAERFHTDPTAIDLQFSIKEALSPSPASVPQPKPKTGEFTRILRELDGVPVPPRRADGRVVPSLGASLEPSGPMMAESVEAAQSAPPEPGEITRLFRGMEKPAAGKSEAAQGDFGRLGSATGSGVELPAEPQPPGSFTQQFLAASESSLPEKSIPSARAGRMGNSEAPPATFPNSFFGANESQREEAKAGEFTQFFRGPFDQPAPAKPLAVPEVPVRPAGQNAGEFTMMFGPGVGSVRAGAPSAIPDAEPSKKSGSFTQLFGHDSLKSSAPSASQPADEQSGLIPAPPVSIDVQRSVGEPARPASAPSPFPTPTPLPNLPAITATPAAMENALAKQAGRTDATNAFLTPGHGIPAPAAAQAPSEFTMFINRRDVDAALAPDPSEAAADADQSSSGFTMPKLTPPPAPKLPAPPKVEAPKAAPAPSLSYWPLITVFTGLLGVGAILVMYFLLRH